MIKDPGPIHQLGFGLQSRDLNYSGDQEGAKPESSFIAKSLQDNPVLKFFAVSAATMAGMAVAGQVIKKGGVSLGVKLQRSSSPRMTSIIKDVREARRLIDQWQGITRDAIYYTDDGIPGTQLTNREALFVPDPNGKYKVGGEFYSDGNPDVQRGGGWIFSQVEKRRAREEGRASLAHWTLKDELSQRMVSQARRLPYELPAAYFMQRGLTDPIFGENRDSDVTWYNPFDVVSDFVTQSVKNTAFMIAPFESAQGGAVHGWRRLMTYADDYPHLPSAQRNAALASTSRNMKSLLSQVGHDAGQVLNKATQVSSQVSGSFATAIDAARQSSYSSADLLHRYRHGMKADFQKTQAKNITKAERWKDYSRILRNNQAFDFLPRPFKGAQTGLSAFSKRWGEIGEEHQALDAMMKLGRNNFEQVHGRNPAMKDALDRAMRPTETSVEELADRLRHLTGGADPWVFKHGRATGRVNLKFQEGSFYHGRVKSLYNARFFKELEKSGVDDDTLALLRRTIDIEPFLKSGQKTKDASELVRVGGKTITAKGSDKFGNPDFWDKVLNEVNITDAATRGKLRTGIRGAYEQTDEVFRRPLYKASLDKRIAKEWSYVERNVLPEYAEQMVKYSKAPFSRFVGPIGNAEEAFLIRQTARQRGFNMYDGDGVLKSLDDTKAFLNRSGFNTHDTDGMTAYLVSKGKISKPWNPKGGNVFGWKALSLNGAINRGYFSGSQSEAEIRQLAGQLDARNPFRGLSDPQVSGLYRSNRGGVVDINRVKQRAWGFADRLSEDLQIPLIHTPPMQLLGYKHFRDLRRAPILKLHNGTENQAFLSGGRQSPEDFSLFIKQRGMSSKGRVVRFGYENERFTATQERGRFKSSSVTGGSITSRALRMAIGDMGRIPSANSNAPRSRLGRRIGQERIDRWKKLAAVDPDQPDSFTSWARRFSTRQTDIGNPQVLAKLIRDGEVTHKGRKLKLTEQGTVVSAADPMGPPIFTAAQVSEAFNDLSTSLRGTSIPKPVVDKLIADSPRLKKLLTYGDGRTPAGRYVGAGPQSITDMKSDAQILDFIKRMETGEKGALSSHSPDVQASVRQAYNLLVRRHVNNATGKASYWDETLPGLSGSGTIVTRRDQLVSDIQQYLLIRGGILDDNFGSTIASLDQRLLELKNTGQISDVQYTESKAAMLSMAVDFSKVKGYKRGTGTEEIFVKAMGHMRKLPIKSALGDLEKGVISSKPDPPLGLWAARAGRRRFGSAPYKFDGLEYNPFKSDRVLVPTFGTAFSRSPSRALASAAGFTTYNDPSSFSGMSIPVSHMFDRLNRYIDITGAALDPTRFAGPLDMFTRGMVGMRALPLVAAGTTALTVDQTAGGIVYGKDERGERINAPLVLGGVARLGAEAQAIGSGIMPGGPNWEEKRKEILEGESAVRQGRYWFLGNTPFKGGKIEYYRPSWYRRLMSGYQYTDDTFGSPLERAAFGYDFSPLRPLDPYHYERKHKLDRPYPVSGEYFTGPWGPVTPALNAVLGPILKPRREYNRGIVQEAGTQMTPIGDAGAQFTPPQIRMAAGEEGYTGFGMGDALGYSSGGGGVGGGPGYGSASGTGYGGGYGGGGTGPLTASNIGSGNMALAESGRISLATGRGTAFAAISAINQDIASIQAKPVGPSAYPIMAGVPADKYDVGVDRLAQTAFSTQEMLGIYGFMFGTAKKGLGLGSSTFSEDTPQLEGAERAFGTSRGFLNLNIGGLGDLPSPLAEGSWANLEFSEIARRFIYNERNGMQYFNPIPNQMGVEHPWLPGSDYFTDFTRGDPFTKVSEGEIRMPGTAYERLNELHPDETGGYGILDQHNILGDIAPYSKEYKALDRMVDSRISTPEQQEFVDTTRLQVNNKRYREEFTPYEYKYKGPEETVDAPLKNALGRAWETISHHDSFVNTKFLHRRTAVEDWERDNVYGATFPEWEDPVEDYLEPMVYRATQRNPITAASTLGLAGTLFMRSAQSKAVGGVIGGTVGASASVIGKTYEKISGERYIPVDRKKELFLEEYTDIMEYVKNSKLANEATAAGDHNAAQEYIKQAGKTMYGLDLNTATTQDMVYAVPKRKREHFESMLYAPEQERGRILSTAGRLERRMLQTAWGQRVEERPDLEQYFENKELPDENWEGWHPNSNMDMVKIKMGQFLGLDMSEMGYYPQQINQANYVNSSYPNLSPDYQPKNSVANLRRMMTMNGVAGDVEAIHTPFPGTRTQIYAGVN